MMTLTLALSSAACIASAGDAAVPAPPQEPVGFVAGAVIGGFAAGPIGAVIGAGVGTWLGNRVHRAGEAGRAQARAAELQREQDALQQSNQHLTAQLADLSQRVQAAESAKNEAVHVLDGLQGDVLFRTGSYEISADLAHQIQLLAEAVARSPKLKVRVDGYADPRGTVEANLTLSSARANAVRDLFLAAGLREDALEVNAFGKSQSVAEDGDGYALERRVRITLEAEGAAAVAQASEKQER
jgi:outer membrane protein OmpA-like peptidoglycan-associated protein